jgi:hypothetical protein
MSLHVRTEACAARSSATSSWPQRPRSARAGSSSTSRKATWASTRRGHSLVANRRAAPHAAVSFYCDDLEKTVASAAQGRGVHLADLERGLGPRHSLLCAPGISRFSSASPLPRAGHIDGRLAVWSAHAGDEERPVDRGGQMTRSPVGARRSPATSCSDRKCTGETRIRAVNRAAASSFASAAAPRHRRRPVALLAGGWPRVRPITEKIQGGWSTSTAGRSSTTGSRSSTARHPPRRPCALATVAKWSGPARRRLALRHGC